MIPISLLASILGLILGMLATYYGAACVHRYAHQPFMDEAVGNHARWFLFGGGVLISSSLHIFFYWLLI